MTPDSRRWPLRAFLLLPAYWVLRDTIRLQASDYVSLVVIPWAVLVLASWLAAGRIFDPRPDRLRLVLTVVTLVCAWGVLQTGRMTTRVVLYWIHDRHWNRRGNQAVATIVARHLGFAVQDT